MLHPTREHQRFIEPNQPRLRMGAQTPTGAVNLAYTYVPALNPTENIVIIDNSSFIPENVATSDQLIFMWPDESHLLRDANGSADIASRTVLLTNVFAGDTPLFYSHRLRYPIYDPVGPDSFGRYRGTGVTVTDLTGQPLPSHLRSRIILTPTEWPDLYWVHVYTSFQTGGVEGYQVQYSAIEVGEDGSRQPRIGCTETLNPQPAFSAVSDMAAVIQGGTSEPHFYRANSAKFACTRIYVPHSSVPDLREPVPFSYEIKADGITFVSGSAAVLNPASVLPLDFDPYQGGSLVLTHNVRELAIAKGVAVTEDTLFQVVSSRSDVRVSCRPDGRGPALATTRVPTDPMGPDGKRFKMELPEAYRLTVSPSGERSFTPTYAVKLGERQPVKLLPPLETDPLESWYPRIQNGRFTRNGYSYFLPEFYRQHFAPDLGLPYRIVTAERPKVIGDRRIRLRHTPLHVRLDESQKPDPAYLQVMVNGVEMAVTQWSVGDGVLELAGAVQETDQIAVRYTYEEQSVPYRGYLDDSGRFWALDLNPGPGHWSTLVDNDGQVKEMPSFHLLDKIIYFYLRPALELDSAGSIKPGTFRRSTVFHSFSEVNEPGVLLLGRIIVRPNATRESVQVRDARKRGGGLKEEISEAVIRAMEPEARYYFDISRWDGEPLQENAVVVIRLCRSILKEFGGTFTHQEVEEVVHKHIAFGVLPIIEYVEDSLIVQRPEGLTAEAIDIEVPFVPPMDKPRLRLVIETI